VTETSNVLISADTLKAKRQTFRKQFQVPGGQKQKLSHLDNLLVLSLGYPHGFGNFSALTKNSDYLFCIDNVDVIELVKYEVNNISCACGVENYLYFYQYLGVNDSELHTFCMDYLIYKLIFSAWNELTSPVWYQRQIQALSLLNEENRDIEEVQSNLFSFLPLFGFIYQILFSTKNLKEFGLNNQIPLIEGLIEEAKSEFGNDYLDNNEAEKIFVQHLPKIRSEMDFNHVSTELLDTLSKVFNHYHLFDVRAYCLYLLTCEEEYSVPNFANKESCTLYQGDQCLVLKDDYQFSSVLLTANEAMEVDGVFANYGKSNVTHEFLAKLWVKNLKQGSGSTRSETINWNDAIKRAKASITQGKYFSSKAMFRDEIESLSLTVNR